MSPDLQSIPLGSVVNELDRRGELFVASCPSRQVLKHVTSQWGVLILCTLLAGMHRFSDLRRKIEGVSEKMLSQTLRFLEADGFIRRVSFPIVPPHVEYSLTPMGEQVAQRVQVLAQWIEEHLPEIRRAQQSSLPKAESFD